MKLRVMPAAIVGMLVVPALGTGQPRQFSLESATCLRLNSVSAEPVVLQGKKGLKLTVSAESQKQFEAAKPEERATMQPLAIVAGLEFSNGVIEAEIAGQPAPDAPEGARGFVGIAFRLQD